MAGDFGLDRGDVKTLLEDPDIVTFVESELAATSIETAASALATKPPSTDYGLSETQREFQQMIRRYANERVKPLAEQIHRDDLDVPGTVYR